MRISCVANATVGFFFFSWFSSNVSLAKTSSLFFPNDSQQAIYLEIKLARACVDFISLPLSCPPGSCFREVWWNRPSFASGLVQFNGELSVVAECR